MLKILPIAAITISTAALILFAFHQFEAKEQRALLKNLSSQLASVHEQQEISNQGIRRLEATIQQIGMKSSVTPIKSRNDDTHPSSQKTETQSGQADTGILSKDGESHSSTSFTLDGIKPDSVAGSQGLMSGDVITLYDGQHVSSLEDVLAADELGFSGQRIEIEIERNGMSRTLTIYRGSIRAEEN